MKAPIHLGTWTRIHKVCNLSTEVLLYLSVAIGGWAFGAVHLRTVLVLNAIGYALGCIVLTKLFVRRRAGWLKESVHENSKGQSGNSQHCSYYSRLIVWLCIAIIGYCTVSIINARAVFDAETLTFRMFDRYIYWLPHTYDKELSLYELANLVALFLYGLSVNDWLRRDFSRRSLQSELVCLRRMTRLVQFLVWTAVAISFVGLLQRLGANDRLLWLYQPQFSSPLSHFGPFAYRGNAAVYVNLIWPLAFFYLFGLRRVDNQEGRTLSRVGGDSRLLTYLGLVVMFVASGMIGSRVGFVIFLLSLLSTLYFVFRFKGWRWRGKGSGYLWLVFLLSSAGAAKFLNVIQRIVDTFVSTEHYRGLDRFEIYRQSFEIFRDSWLFGVGPGAFSSVYQMHRAPRLLEDLDWMSNVRLQDWSAWAHSDPIEFLVDFGVLGFGLLISLFAMLFFAPIVARGKRTLSDPIVFVYISICGFCWHSLVDFPFQVYGLNHAFVVVLVLLGSIKQPFGMMISEDDQRKSGIEI